MNFEWLYRGTPGHPLHPPLTDATIGTYTFATIAAVLSKVGIAEQEAAQGWTLALIVGLIITGPTALTGLADWVRIERGTRALPHGDGAHDRDAARDRSLPGLDRRRLQRRHRRRPAGRRLHPHARRLLHADGRRLARRLDRLQLRHARAEPGRGTGEPCGSPVPHPEKSERWPRSPSAGCRRLTARRRGRGCARARPSAARRPLLRPARRHGTAPSSESRRSRSARRARAPRRC